MAIVNQCVTSIEDKNMIHFIVNEHSRSGKGVRVWRQIEALLKKEEEPYRIWRTEYVGHATKLAKEISNLDEKEIKLVVVGGDGTINEVVNGIADFGKIRFGIIPTGSGNDCARGLGISGKPEELLLRILESNGTIVDTTNAQVFDMSKYADLSGNLVMGGSTSTEAAVKALADEFTALFPKVTYEYNATGSGAGVKNAGGHVQKMQVAGAKNAGGSPYIYNYNNNCFYALSLLVLSSIRSLSKILQTTILPIYYFFITHVLSCEASCDVMFFIT